jgi:hypothetical protein
VIALFWTAGKITAEDARRMKMFLSKPPVIEDQGSLFSGGVPKVTVVHENPIYERSATSPWFFLSSTPGSRGC